jgi:hypothetical protein
MALMISRAAGNRLRSSSSPSCFPAFENGGQARSDYIHFPYKWCRIELLEILFDHVPFRAIVTQSSASVVIQFNQADMIETGLFKAKSLPTCPRAQLKNCNFLHQYSRLVALFVATG